MPFPKSYPLESYPPRLEEILKRGARGEDFTIPCRSPSEAHRLQHMLHSFRHRARAYHGDHAPEKWKPLYIAVIGLVRDEQGKKTIVHVFSRHDEFKDIFASLPPAEEPIPSLVGTDDPLAEFDPQPEAKPEGSGGG